MNSAGIISNALASFLTPDFLIPSQIDTLRVQGPEACRRLRKNMLSDGRISFPIERIVTALLIKFFELKSGIVRFWPEIDWF
jgi:hypothetical protein